MDTVFETYDLNNDLSLGKSEFANLLAKELPEKDYTYNADAITRKIFARKTSLLKSDFTGHKWIQALANEPRTDSAILVIDVQHDFIDGSLPVRDAVKVIPPLNRILRAVDPLTEVHEVYSLDWHPTDHVSFYSNRELRPLAPGSKRLEDLELYDTATFRGPPEYNQTLWPDHAVQETKGAELHPDLLVRPKVTS